MENSALNWDNIYNAFEELIEQIYQNNSTIIEQDKNVEIDKGVNLDEENNDENVENKKKCCV